MVCGGLMLLSASCTGKFEDFNTNPQAPTSDQMQGDNAATASLISSMIPVMVQGQENNAQMLDVMIGNEYGGMLSNKKCFGAPIVTTLHTTRPQTGLEICSTPHSRKSILRSSKSNASPKAKV